MRLRFKPLVFFGEVSLCCYYENRGELNSYTQVVEKKLKG